MNSPERQLGVWIALAMSAEGAAERVLQAS
jgi:hypothetical protein